MADNISIGKDNRLKILDFVRAFATIAVFVFHAGYLFYYSRDGFVDWYRFVASAGTIGVDIFFVLSGFLLFYQMYKKGDLNGAKLKDYIKKRALRILPLYYFSLFFILLVFRRDIFFADNGIMAILYNLVFLRGVRGAGDASISINPVYWSLIVEVHFYILLPIFYYIFSKFRKIWLFFVVIALGFAYRILIVTLFKNPSIQFFLFTPADFDFFAFGMLGAYLYANRNRYLGFLGKWFTQIFLILAFLLFVYFYDLSYNPTLAYIFAPALLAFIIVLCMLSFLLNEKTIIGRVFSSAPFMFIAKISFSVYIWHAIVIGKVDALLLPGGVKFLLDVGITLVVSTITYYLIEAPFLKFKSKKIKTKELSEVGESCSGG